MFETNYLLGILYREYNISNFTWEFLKILQKVSIIILINIFSDSIILKGTFSALVLLVLGLLTLTRKPYQRYFTTNLDVTSLLISFFSMTLAVCMSQFSNNSISYIFGAYLLIFINFIFILICGFYFL